MIPKTHVESDNGGNEGRGQAFTLEGLVSAILVLTALWYALQVVVVTPATGGDVGSSAQIDLQQQADDALVVAAQAETGSLDELLRYWSQGQRTFEGARNSHVGYGSKPIPGPFGEILENTFAARGLQYNVEMRYLHRDPAEGQGTVTVTSRGNPTEDAVVASQHVVLYDNMTLTGPDTGAAELWQYDTHPTANPEPGKSGYYPVPNAIDGPVYNVVEVRLIVW